MTHLTPAAPSTTPPSPSAGTPRWVWLLLMLLVAALVAGITGVLVFAGDAHVPDAILKGGTAFGGTIALLLGMAYFLGGGRG